MSPELEQIVNRALRKDPDERWQRLGYMHSALAQQKFESAGIMFEYLPEPLPAASKKPSRFWNVAALVMLSMFLSMLLVGAGSWVSDHRPWTRNPAPVSPVATAAEPDAPRPARKKAAAGDVLTNKTVIGMVKANMAARSIVSRIRSSKTNFNLSAPEIVRLGQAGVPEQVMDAMHNPKPAAKSNRPQ